MKLLIVINPNCGIMCEQPAAHDSLPQGKRLSGGRSPERIRFAIVRALQQAQRNDPSLKNLSMEFLIEYSTHQFEQALLEKIKYSSLQDKTDENAGYHTVIVVGGDGTIRHTLSIIAAHCPETPIGIIPNGTGNLLANHLGIPLQLEPALLTALHGRLRPMDIGKLENQAGIHYFSMMAGAGLDADIIDAVDRTFKQKWQLLAYLIQGVRKVFHPTKTRFHIEIDGKSYHSKAIGVIIANAANLVGPFLTLAPDAKTDDGLLDILVLNIRQELDAVPIFLQILSGRHTQPKWAQSRINRYQGKKIKIRTKRPLKIEADGDIIGGTTPFTIETLPGCICIRVPEETATDKTTPLPSPGKRLYDSLSRLSAALVRWFH